MPNISFGSPTVDGNINVVSEPTIATPTSTQLAISIQDATGGSYDIYTVPAGKKFHLMGISGFKTGAVAEIGVNDNAGTPLVVLKAGSDISNSYTPATPIHTFAATEDVKIVSTASSKISITGILEDV